MEKKIRLNILKSISGVSKVKRRSKKGTIMSKVSNWQDLGKGSKTPETEKFR